MNKLSAFRTALAIGKDLLLLGFACLCLFHCPFRSKRTPCLQMQKAFETSVLRVIAHDLMGKRGGLISEGLLRDFEMHWLLYPSLEAYEEERAITMEKDVDNMKGRPVIIVQYDRRSRLAEGTLGLHQVVYVLDCAAPTNYYVRVVH